jgi:hypothetical protein
MSPSLKFTLFLCGQALWRNTADGDLKQRLSETVFRIHKKKGDNCPMTKGKRSCLLIFHILLFLGSLTCLIQTNRNNKQINAINPSFYYIESSTALVQLPSEQTAGLHFRETNVEILDSYKCRSMEDCYALVFAIKSYSQSHDIEIVRSNTDMVGELRLHNFLYRIGYKQSETKNADLEYICDRRWYVNIASRVIGWIVL